ncbi:putative redox protein [Aquimarina sp. EL_43]|uniref:OsmC family protein n=1 Tax=Aquimarina TaxID=290174 RepID=UPI000470A84E|nr:MULTISPECIES: OsmC family protein [Aquimarina]MBG6131390.1 putative redox protein [Aquimarina sp. EL_35]MBG6151727.1 putative redox protein [Aquimarina sp. EL_32]MBG6169657.1 putative redox protein [Aquimarina sp. EL_43]
MKIQLKRIDNDYHFELKNERGHVTYIDSTAKVGGHDQAPSPMEYVLMGVAGCSAIDIISILKKQRQEITDYRAEVYGAREEIDGAKPFKKITVTVYLEGDITPEKALRAAELSFEKYCSVSKTLEPTATIEYKVVVNNKEV